MLAPACTAARLLCFGLLLAACSTSKRDRPPADVPVDLDPAKTPPQPGGGDEAGPAPMAADAGTGSPAPIDAAMDPPPPPSDAATPPPDSEPAPGVESTPMVDEDDGCGDVPAGTLVEISVAAQALLADRVRHRVYATVGSSSKLHPDSLVAIDPAQSKVSAAVPIGPAPTSLAISDNAGTLWVALEGRHEVRKVDLTTPDPRPGARYVLTEPSAQVLAGEMAVLPGEPNSLAISLRRVGVSPSYAGAVVLDDGVPRPNPPDTVTGLDWMVAGPPGYLFGMDTGSVPMFSVVSVDSSGPTPRDLRSTFVRAPDITGNPPSDLVYDTDGYVYASSGDVIDVRDPEIPRVAGRFGFSGAVAAVPKSDVALMLSIEQAGALRLRVLDSSTFTQRSSKRIAPTKAFEVIRDVAYLGPHCLAFIHERPSAATSSVYVLHEDLAGTREEPVEPVAVAHDGVTELPLAAAALAFDPKRRVLYATLAGDAGAYANRLVTIDPSTAEIVHSVPIGSNPGALAISADAANLWVSLTGSYEIRRVDLTMPQPTPAEVQLLPRTSSHDLGMAAASSLLVLSDGGASLAVASYFTDGRSPQFAGNLVLDGGSPRTKQIEMGGPSRLLPGPPGYLLGLGALGFFSSVVDGDGLSQPQMVGGFRYAYPCGAYDSDGLVYSASGEVVDVSSPTEPSLRGTLPHSGAVLPLPDSATAYMVSASAAQTAAPLSFRTLDTSNLTQVGTRPLGSAEVYEPVCELVRTGPSSFAFIAKIAGTAPRTTLYFVKNAL